MSKLELQIAGYLLFSGGIFSFFYGLGFLLRKEKRNKLLGLNLFILSIWQFSAVYSFGKYYLNFPHFYGIHIPFVLFGGPLLLIYNELVLEKKIEKKFYFKHFLIPILGFLLYIPFLLKSEIEKLDWIASLFSGNKDLYQIIFLSLNPLLKISLIFYISYVIYKNRFLFIRNEKTEKRYIHILYWLIPVLLDLLFGLTGFLIKNFRFIVYSAMYLPFSLFYLLIMSILYPDSLAGIQIEIRKKYEQSKIKKLDTNEILLKLEKLMLEEKIFSDEDLSITRVAEELEITVHQLSQILNEILNTNFNQYINKYRIEESKILLIEEKDRSILSIGFAVGFNSKSSFNRAFKQNSGFTPLEFRNLRK